MLSSPKTESDQLKDVYIYGKISPEAGYEKLNTYLKKVGEDFLKKTNNALWLLRESREHGKLTVDFMYWDNTKQDYIKNSKRLALTESGWEEVGGSEIEQYKNSIVLSAENVATHESSLLPYIY